MDANLMHEIKFIDLFAGIGGFHNGKIRRLTPRECERLQGFPDDWTLVNNMSDTQRYKMLGNAVTTNVITEIGKVII